MMARLALALGLVLIACGNAERSWGQYEESQEGFVVTIVHTSTPRVACGTEQMRQTLVRIELPRRPTSTAPIDLSTAHVSYAYGGQIAGFHGTICHGTLALDGDKAHLDVSCRDPATGEQRSSAESVVLTRR